MARENLKRARNDAGMTQQAVADKLGISLRYYCHIEAGTRTGDFEIWDQLEDMFGVHQRMLREQDGSGKSFESVVREIWRKREGDVRLD